MCGMLGVDPLFHHTPPSSDCLDGPIQQWWPCRAQGGSGYSLLRSRSLGLVAHPSYACS